MQFQNWSIPSNLAKGGGGGGGGGGGWGGVGFQQISGLRGRPSAIFFFTPRHYPLLFYQTAKYQQF